MKALLSLFQYINFKTIYFNFRYFKFYDAIKFPVFIASNMYFKTANGSVIIKGPLKSGMIKIGFGNVGIFDNKKSRCIWQVAGKVEFLGSAQIGHGSKITVGPQGSIVFGDKFRISAESALVAINNITFGDNVLLSWDILVMDNDFHKLYDKNKNIINAPKPVVFGNDIWIGCRTTILKGVNIPNNTVIAAGTILSQSITEGNNVYGGTPLKTLKQDITWER